MDPAQLQKADVLWQQLQREQYRSFVRAPGFEKRRPSSVPHNDPFDTRPITVDIYINDVLQQALQQKKPLQAWPVGSLLVKDGFKHDEHFMVVAMQKGPQGWFWVQWNSAGKPDFVGQPEPCLNCHREGDDMVRAFRFPQHTSD